MSRVITARGTGNSAADAQNDPQTLSIVGAHLLHLKRLLGAVGDRRKALN